MTKSQMIYEMLELSCSYYHDNICEISKRNCRDTQCNGYKNMEKILDAGYCKAFEVEREIFEEIDDLKRYIRLSEDIAIKCKRENGVKNEEYWKGQVSAFREIRAYIDAEFKRKYTESEDTKLND